MHIVPAIAHGAAPQLEWRQEMVWLKSDDQVLDFEIAVDQYASDGNRPALSRSLIALGLPASQIRWHLARPGHAMMAASLDDGS